MKLAPAAIVAAAACAASSHAAISLATSGSTLYRTNLATGLTETFNLGDAIVSQSVMADGSVIAYSNSRGPDGYEVYELLNPLGAAPTLSLLETRATQAPTHTEVDGTIYAMAGGRFYTVDDSTYELSMVKNLGISGVGGSAYDALTDSFYIIARNDNLYRIDGYDTSDPTAVLVGDTGADVYNQGMEFVDGVLYAAIQNQAADTLSIGTIDTGTGLFTSLTDIGIDASGPTSLAVLVPTPGTVAIAGLAGLAATRRRRA